MLITLFLASMKKCFKCGGILPRTEFYFHPMMADKLLGKCKTCTKRDVSLHREKNVIAIREYDNRRAKAPHRIAMKIRVTKRWLAADKRRTKCANAVHRALRKGTLKRLPCLVCGSLKSLAHHQDYNKPLDVMWLCQVHHKAQHKAEKEC